MLQQKCITGYTITVITAILRCHSFCSWQKENYPVIIKDMIQKILFIL